MKLIYRNLAISLFIFAGAFSPTQVQAQTGALPVLDSALLEQQVEYLVNRTRIYDGFRAIRDDIFLKMTSNALDSLNKEKLEVATLSTKLRERDFQIENLQSDLSRAKNERDEAIRTKDSFSFLGIQMQKGAYNTFMWILVLILLGAGVFLFLLFKRSHVVTSATKKELEKTREEYEEYRKSSREKYEKLVVNHHNEIMKLKRS
jgi:hypothetical protein